MTINGSTNGPDVPSFGPSVFSVLPGPAFNAWYAVVKTPPSDWRWRAHFQARLGSPTSDYSDLSYDAAAVFLTAIRKTARIDHHDLVINRFALAPAVGSTHDVRGVTCTVTIDAATGYRIDDPAALALRAHQGATTTRRAMNRCGTHHSPGRDRRLRVSAYQTASQAPSLPAAPFCMPFPIDRRSGHTTNGARWLCVAMLRKRDAEDRLTMFAHSQEERIAQ